MKHASMGFAIEPANVYRADVDVERVRKALDERRLRKKETLRDAAKFWEREALKAQAELRSLRPIAAQATRYKELWQAAKRSHEVKP